MPDIDVSLSGTLGRDPELRYTTGGRGVASVGCAVNRRWKNRNDEWEEQTSWFNLVCWGDLGEHVAESLSKGDRVIVRGHLEQRSWETDSGEKRSTIEVVVDDIGPSLKWAKVDVFKIERQRSESAPRREPSGGGSPAPALSYGEEEPFLRSADIGDL